MKVLALDSSGLVASVAVVEDDGVGSSLLAEYTDRSITKRHILKPCSLCWMRLFL